MQLPVMSVGSLCIAPSNALVLQGYVEVCGL